MSVLYLTIYSYIESDWCNLLRILWCLWLGVGGNMNTGQLCSEINQVSGDVREIFVYVCKYVRLWIHFVVSKEGCCNFVIEIRVWGLDMVIFLFWHKNKLMHGHIYSRIIQGKTCGYLDGIFIPDWLSIVLTDDSGRVTIVDTLTSA